MEPIKQPKELNIMGYRIPTQLLISFFVAVASLFSFLSSTNNVQITKELNTFKDQVEAKIVVLEEHDKSQDKLNSAVPLVEQRVTSLERNLDKYFETMSSDIKDLRNLYYNRQ